MHNDELYEYWIKIRKYFNEDEILKDLFPSDIFEILLCLVANLVVEKGYSSMEWLLDTDDEADNKFIEVMSECILKKIKKYMFEETFNFNERSTKYEFHQEKVND